MPDRLRDRRRYTSEIIERKGVSIGTISYREKASQSHSLTESEGLVGLSESKPLQNDCSNETSQIHTGSDLFQGEEKVNIVIHI